MHKAAFNDPHREYRIFFTRLSVAMAVVLVLTAVLAWRFYHLQMTRHEYFATRSESNRVHVRPVSPTRGLIHDRNGVLLADNKAGFSLSIVVERAGDLDGLLSDLDALLGLKEEELERFRRQKSRRKPYEPVPLRLNLTEREQSLLAVNEYRLEGVEITAQLVRHYPHGPLLSHVLGYVGRINERELSSLDSVRYSGTYVIGKTGIEKAYEQQLLGQVGYEYVETNARGRVMRVLERIAPQVGKDLDLSLDIRLQQVAWEALGDERGAVVAMDTNTGGVLAMVSKPGFDNNLFVTGISSTDYKNLLNSPARPLFNRVTQGQYPPGSTVKPVYGLAALESGAMGLDTTINDPGFFRLPNHSHRYRDWKRGGHGSAVGIHEAIVESCDTYFYNAGYKMGIEVLHRYGTRFGLGEPTGIDMPSERSGLMPSRAWKRGARGEPWYPGDTINASIGQGFVLATPLQLAVMTARVANRGERLVPRLVNEVGGETRNQPRSLGHIEADEKYWNTVTEAMKAVVHGRRGTARGIGEGLTYEMAGKTGTAQVIGIAQGEEYDAEEVAKRNRDHALFIAFAPREKPEIAVSVIVENGEHGSTAAAPIARQLLDAYMALKTIPGRSASATD